MEEEIVVVETAPPAPPVPPVPSEPGASGGAVTRDKDELYEEVRKVARRQRAMLKALKANGIFDSPVPTPTPEPIKPGPEKSPNVIRVLGTLFGKR